MYQVNDAVVYGSDGVCIITALVNRLVEGKEQPYYELHPVFQSDSVLYLPVNGPRVLEKLRPVLSREELSRVLEKARGEVFEWIARDSERKTVFQEALRSGDPLRLLGVLRCLQEHREQLRLRGKRLHAADEGLLRDAERILFDELSYALGIERSAVLPYLKEQGVC